MTVLRPHRSASAEDKQAGMTVLVQGESRKRTCRKEEEGDNWRMNGVEGQTKSLRIVQGANRSPSLTGRST